MAEVAFRLDNAWYPIEGDDGGGFVFTLYNLSSEPISGFKLAYTALTRVKDGQVCDNAVFLRRNANFHQFAPPEGLVLVPGACWQFTVQGLWRPARHRTDGAKSAYLTLADGRHVAVAVDDLMLQGRVSEPAPVLLPKGEVSKPFSLLPWPVEANLMAGDGFPVAIYPTKGTDLPGLQAVERINALYRRLFAVGHVPFSLAPVDQGKALKLAHDPVLGASAYRLDFTEEITLSHGDEAGRQYGLTALAQMLHGARQNPALFRFPASGQIKDAPRYGWRGCHLDVSRQFYPTQDVLRLIDIMAWMKLNIFHWHLTDDEAWRLEIKAYPQLTTLGVLRGPDEPMLPQLGNGAEPVGGFYTQEDVAHIVAHAALLHVEVVPEIDIPGHSTAILTALPELVDGQEAPDSYRSVQGYPNNALNPAIEQTYVFLGKVLDEMATLFPSNLVHVGGDEVAANTWMASPLAKKLMEQEGLDGTFGLQSHFMKRIQQMLKERGKKLAGWDEVSHGGGVDPQGTLLMAWQKPEVGLDLARQGYDVVMTPGQAYYLDMVQDEAWQEPGASWAGTVPPHHTYTYEAVAEFPDALKPRMRGVQACIWSEHFLNRDYFNHLVFPRLPAVAEAAWTPRDQKDWLRFAALAPLMPRF
ncbi:beta-N-acetylhexosaminidase [Agrobacterium vitis]|uniref:beta-N-acetylhexosaminidase n=1 Tax=Agrobacterium vitis TaxID=373 RepID=A0A368NY84_AGRVI|nr:family 20 glycosylhydrolase [Agrobacterium vitis]KAA3511245.1 beta-N-acetylhexosaminidase [Agrobacterium vitis]KAA3527933.1 beta-N-acetylhexosaminidase [Agrobacterium vitis]MCF1478477.1 beta-N-acetylhexosaminidase [Agrobacterium vitis]MUZ96638.1 family 20 glycosylhydrolase [Agrobacterium vitis]MVA28509.1 family 20 glycosylhydrolase [Agrobacterium vitis]